MKSKKLSEEHKRKIGLANRGRIISPEGRLKMSLAHKDKWFPNLFQKGNIPWCKGTKGVVKGHSGGFKKGHKQIGGFIKGDKHTKETKRKMSLAKKGKSTWAKGKHIKFNNALEIWHKNGGQVWNKGIYGKQNSNWKGGISNEPYSIDFNNKLKEKIRKRDNYTCQVCNMVEEEHLIVYGYSLIIHHIDYNKKNSSENNLATVCIQCNSRVNFNRGYWTKLFYEKNTINNLI